MLIYYIIFLVIMILGFLPISKTIKTLTMIIILTIFAGTRMEIDNDYLLYRYFFEFIPKGFTEFKQEFGVDVCIYFVTTFSRLIFYDTDNIINFSFLVFAFLGVTTKMVAITKYAHYYSLSLLLYFTCLFFIQEMTTIRAGVASGIFLMAIPDIIEKKYWPLVFKILLCFVFHSSSIFFVIVFVLIRFLKDIRYYYIALGVSMLLVVLSVDIVSLLRLDLLFPKVAVYLEVMRWLDEGKVNIFNFRILISLFFLIYFAFIYKKYIKNDATFDVLFKIHIISLILFFALSLSAVTFSLRSFELLSVIQIFLYPLIIKTMHPKFKIFGPIIIVMICLLQFYYMVEVSNIFKPYKSWL